MTDRSIKFSNSRTFPGQCQLISAFIVSVGMVSITRFILPANFRTKYRTRMGISSRLSRSDGMRIGKHIQAVKQIAAKLFLRHALRQIPIGGCDQPQIHFDRSRPSQPFEFMVLQNPQQLGLQLQRDFADLVEEESAFISQFQAPNLLPDRSGKCALFVTEQFALQQPGRNRGAIQGDETFVLPFAGAMDRTRNQTLCRSRFRPGSEPWHRCRQPSQLDPALPGEPGFPR